MYQYNCFIKKIHKQLLKVNPNILVITAVRAKLLVLWLTFEKEIYLLVLFY